MYLDNTGRLTMHEDAPEPDKDEIKLSMLQLLGKVTAMNGKLQAWQDSWDKKTKDEIDELEYQAKHLMAEFIEIVLTEDERKTPDMAKFIDEFYSEDTN